MTTAWWCLVTALALAVAANAGTGSPNGKGDESHVPHLIRRFSSAAVPREGLMAVALLPSASPTDSAALARALARELPDETRSALETGALGPRVGPHTYLFPASPRAFVLAREHPAVAFVRAVRPPMSRGSASDWGPTTRARVRVFPAASAAAASARAAHAAAACVGPSGGVLSVAAAGLDSVHALLGPADVLRGARCLTSALRGSALSAAEPVHPLRAHTTGDVLSEARVPGLVLASGYPLDGREVARARRFEAVGLNGTGLRVALADTGLDARSCFFSDPSVPVPIDPPLGFNSPHRKIAAVLTSMGNARDDVVSHGTFVAGVMVGESTGSAAPGASSVAAFAGLASGARLVFTDLQAAAPNATNGLSEAGDVDLLVTAVNLTTVLAAHLAHGAAVSVLPFGNGNSLIFGSYGSNEREADAWLLRHPSALAVLSAGNEVSSSYSITGQCAMKNALCVGTSYATTDDTRRAMAASTPLVVLGSGLDDSVAAAAGLFGAAVPSEPLTAQLVLASPELACEPLVGSLAGTIALVARGECAFADKARAVAAAGARAMIVFSTEDSLLAMGGLAPTVAIPCVLVSARDGVRLRAAALAGARVSLVASTIDETTAAAVNGAGGRTTVAAFSARGPTIDGRLKPDLFAPGVNVSSALASVGASAVPTCGAGALTIASGSSISAGVVGAAAVLVSEYFARGFYPTGVQVAANGFEPPATLVRAVLLGSALEATARPRDADSSFVQPLPRGRPTPQGGFGVLSLGDALPLAVPQLSADPLAAFDIYTTGATPWSVSSTATSRLCVRVTRAGRPLSATLAWADPPLAIDSFVASELVYDLDLALSCSDGTVTRGNSAVSSSSHGVFRARDELNNVERVRVDYPTSELVCMLVARGIALPTTVTVPASLYVTGHFAVEPDATCYALGLPTCGRECLDHGRCINGLCECADMFTGASCAHGARDISMRTVVTATVAPFGWAYFSLALDSADEASVVEVKMVSPVGDPDVFIGSSRLPTLHSFVLADVTPNRQNLVHSMLLPARTISQPGLAVIGIYGYCCSDASFLLAVRGVADSPLLTDGVSAAPALERAAWTSLLVLALLVAML